MAALFTVWMDAISSDPMLLRGAVDEGLRKLGYPAIKPEQLEAVESLLKGEDVFLSVPTGFYYWRRVACEEVHSLTLRSVSSDSQLLEAYPGMTSTRSGSPDLQTTQRQQFLLAECTTQSGRHLWTTRAASDTWACSWEWPYCRQRIQSSVVLPSSLPDCAN